MIPIFSFLIVRPQAVTVKLPKTNFMAVANDHGYIMCGALDVALL
ncbi:hypothetical protein ACWFOZ_18120, partial [Bacillus subtilis]